MGSLGFIILGLATLTAVTCVILKILNMQEKAEERADRLRQYKREISNENADW